MVELQTSPTELTTAATDLLLALFCAFAAWRLPGEMPASGFRRRVWVWVFALVGLASSLGTLAHGLLLPPWLADAIWHPLYLALGLSVALILVGALFDARGERFAQRWLGPALIAGVTAYAVTQAFGGAFIVFVVYEGIATVTALALYIGLTLRYALPGAALVASGLALNLVAAGVQASDINLELIFEFDHNGLFHIVLLPALILLYSGIVKGHVAAEN